MNLTIEPGKYVIAVSGGVDSVVLLNLLAKKSGLVLVVAHFDHGIRPESVKDRKFVENSAKKYNLEFFYEEGHLGQKASEAIARAKRYEFLEKIRDKTLSSAIVTAHHQDDVIETIVINLLRGTGRKGLSSLADRPGLFRPLVKIKKQELIDYALREKLDWREDETNNDQTYLRNYIRHTVIPKLSENQKRQLVEINKKTSQTNEEIDRILAKVMASDNSIRRNQFVSLSHDIASEIIANWLRNNNLPIDRATIIRLVIKLKTMDEGKKIEVTKSAHFEIVGGIIRINTLQAV